MFLSPLLLRLVVLSHSLAASAETERHLSRSSTVKETCSVLPAARQETSSRASGVLRTINAKDLQLDVTFTQTTTDDGTNKEIQAFLTDAWRRFESYTFQSLPDYPSDDSVSPDDMELIPLSSVNVTIENGSLVSLAADNVSLEEYWLTVPSTRNSFVELNATTIFGVLRGLQTLSQLIVFGWLEEETKVAEYSEKPVFVIQNTNITIYDVPAYSYRGLLIDTSRHFLPLSLILQNLDVMEMNKLNVFHWHMTDSQSWPFQSTTFPELSEKGAYRPERIYSHDDIRRVLHAAYRRGIRVIPEFDMPGHTASIGKGLPELLSNCSNGQSLVGSVPLNPTADLVYEFVAALYNEIAELFPDPYVHVGGDEVAMDCWKRSRAIQEWMKENKFKSEKELFNYFEMKLLDIVGNQLDKKTVVWQEVFDLGLTIRDDTVVDVWQGWGGNDRRSLNRAIQTEYKAVLSSCWYLDHLQKTWGDYYDCKPWKMLDDGSQDKKNLLIGGHASMWGEMVDASNFMTRVWPRASAVAELLWSGESSPLSCASKHSFEQRISKFRCRLVARGFPAGPTGPGSCPSEPKTNDQDPNHKENDGMEENH